MRTAALLLSAAATACGGATMEAQAQTVVGPAHNEADVRFVTGMIAHHGQALEMAALVPGRATRADVRLMAERIEVSQRDEIALMQRWLQARGEAVPSADSAHAHHHGGAHAQMPGMLTPEDM
jgi:uncharacterized protein (DUF305 family)